MNKRFNKKVLHDRCKGLNLFKLPLEDEVLTAMPENLLISVLDHLPTLG